MRNSSSLNIYKGLLVILVTSLAITGISYLDDKIWNIVLLAIGMIAYSVVGCFFSIGLLNGKNEGKGAYTAVFIILLFLGYGVFCGIMNLQKWIMSWSLWVKITVPTVLFLMIIFTIFLIVKTKRFSKSKETEIIEDENNQ